MKPSLNLIIPLTCLLTAACAEETVYSLQNEQPSSVARIIGDASLTECPNGGVVLGYGIDENGDGQLETDEIDGTTVICNGADGVNGTNGTDGEDGADALVDRLSVTTLEAGDACANGGVVIAHGLDTNENGLLDEEEIEETEILCHGESAGEPVDGDSGTTAPASLIRLTSVVAGSDCPNGGARIDTGVDIDNNGVLDDEEVTDSVFVCNGVDGASAPSSLVDVTRVENAEGCFGAAAIRIDSGVDADGDGTLAEGEVSSTEIFCEPTTSGDECELVTIEGVNVLTCGDTSAVIMEEPNRIVASITCVGMLEGTSFGFDYSVAQMAYGDVFASASVRDAFGQTGASSYYGLQQTGFETAPIIFTYDVLGDPTGGFWTISLDRDTLATTVRYEDIDTADPELAPVVLEWAMMPESCVVNTY